MSSAICFNLDQSKISSSGNGVKYKISYFNRIHSSLFAVGCLNNGYVEKQPVAWKEYCMKYWFKELKKSMDRCSYCRNITEILLKMALNTI